ncbi:MAG: helix-turn-helix domain-containing protein [Steroidobacteraceae bacterium]
MPKAKPSKPTQVSHAARPASAPPRGNFNLGKRLRRLRQARALTLGQLAHRADLARSTVSKIENEQMSPTFDLLQKLAAGLGIGLTTLVSGDDKPVLLGRRSVTRKGQGRFLDMPYYRHEFVCTEIVQRSFMPMKTRVRAHAGDGPVEVISHSGEEYVLVLEGEVEFHTELYEPLRLAEGDSLYYDSTMAHAFVSVSAEDASLLWIGTVERALGRPAS